MRMFRLAGSGASDEQLHALVLNGLRRLTTFGFHSDDPGAGCLLKLTAPDEAAFNSAVAHAKLTGLVRLLFVNRQDVEHFGSGAVAWAGI